MEQNIIPSLLIALMVGIASGSIGAFVILRRMALVGDALSHVALPGIAIALAYQIDPFWGVLAFLLGGAVTVWWLGEQTKLPTEALVGLLFTASLAIGILTIPDSEILESLFGVFPAMSPLALGIFLSVAALLSILSFLFSKQFLFSIVSRDLSAVGGVGKYYDLGFFLIFALAVALGIKLVGTLLMGALTIIPASIAKNLSQSMKGYMVLSAILGGIISGGGVFFAYQFAFLPGPSIILTGIVLFIVSLPFRR